MWSWIDMDTKNTFTGRRARVRPEGVAEGGRTAHDIKKMHTKLGLNSEALKQIPIVNTDEELEQGSTYIDLAVENPRPFTATAEDIAGEENLYVRKGDVAYEIWNHLVGDEKPGEEFDGSPNYETR